MPLWHNRHVDRKDTPTSALQGRKTQKNTKKADRVDSRQPQMERKPPEKGTDSER